MVSAVTAILSDSGVDADGIKAEEFAGFDLNQMHRPAGQKRNRWVLIGALALATAAIVLHLSAAFSIFSNSFGGILKANPVFYVVVGVLLGGSSSRSGTLPACTTAAGASLVTSAGILAAMRPRPWASNADRQRSGDPHMAASSQRRPMGLAAVV
jgi:hypothetical protein